MTTYDNYVFYDFTQNSSNLTCFPNKSHYQPTVGGSSRRSCRKHQKGMWTFRFFFSEEVSPFQNQALVHRILTVLRKKWCAMDPINKTPQSMLAFFYQHQPDPSYGWWLWLKNYPQRNPFCSSFLADHPTDSAQLY